MPPPYSLQVRLVADLKEQLDMYDKALEEFNEENHSETHSDNTLVCVIPTAASSS